MSYKTAEQRRAHSAKYRAEHKVIIIETCPVCGVQFQRAKARLTYCSKACSAIGYARVKAAQQKAHNTSQLRDGSDVAELRARYGLRLLNPGRTSCLKCGRDFNSPDKRTVRLCEPCNIKNSEICLQTYRRVSAK